MYLLNCVSHKDSICTEVVN